MRSGSVSRAMAISLSPFGQWRFSALASVDEASPASRETADSVVPLFFSSAMISAGCQSLSVISVILVSFHQTLLVEYH